MGRLFVLVVYRGKVRNICLFSSDNDSVSVFFLLLLSSFVFLLL